MREGSKCCWIKKQIGLCVFNPSTCTSVTECEQIGLFVFNPSTCTSVTQCEHWPSCISRVCACTLPGYQGTCMKEVNPRSCLKLFRQFFLHIMSHQTITKRTIHVWGENNKLSESHVQADLDSVANCRIS